jgi:hypothetical protein
MVFDPTLGSCTIEKGFEMDTKELEEEASRVAQSHTVSNVSVAGHEFTTEFIDFTGEGWGFHNRKRF